jgi:hypothetical protein
MPFHSAISIWKNPLGYLAILLGVVLGNTHILTTSYRQFWDMLSTTFRDELRDQIDIIRSVQLIAHMWFTSKKLNGASPTPSFVDILFWIQLASYQMPTLPGIYHELTYSVKPAVTCPSPPTSLVSTDMSSDLSAISGSVQPGQTLLGSSLLRATTRPGGNSYVRNIAPDAELQALIPAQFQLCTVIKNDPVPLNDENFPMCLSFHLRRGCWTQCKRAHDHNRSLTIGEKQ